ncbi:MAG: hypothetical protein IJM51_08320 [Clostridia bacterium]|nr:hypothetical protein [Clostridia bacterium]
MKGNRQIGLDGRIFINDCLSDGLFFVYSIMLSGILGAVGDIMKLTGKSGTVMNTLTNGLILMDLACCLGLVLVSYYVYFMNCGESMPKLGVKPLIYLEYVRLAYYGMLLYDVLYRFCDQILHSGHYPIAMSVFYVVYMGWLISCSFAAMFILTVLNQNMIRRSYSFSFKMLALTGLSINIVMPIVFFITKIWIKGAGDGFYSSALCDFLRLGIAPIFYAALWFLFLNAIDQVDRVFNEVDNAIRDKNYRIEFEEEQGKKRKKKKSLQTVGLSNDKKVRKKKKPAVAASKPSAVPSETEVSPTEKADEAGDSGISAEIAFETSFDSPVKESDDAEKSESDDIGGMVDINALFEKRENDAPPEPQSSNDGADYAGTSDEDSGTADIPKE